MVLGAGGATCLLAAGAAPGAGLASGFAAAGGLVAGIAGFKAPVSPMASDAISHGPSRAIVVLFNRAHTLAFIRHLSQLRNYLLASAGTSSIKSNKDTSRVSMGVPGGIINKFRAGEMSTNFSQEILRRYSL